MRLRDALFLAGMLMTANALAGCGHRDQGRPERVRRMKPEPPVEARVDLTGLSAFAGRLPDDVGLWETQPLKGRMQALLEEKYPTFVASLSDAEPIEEAAGLLCVRGKSEVRGRVDRALVVIDPKADRLYLWARVDGQVLEGRDKGPALTLPATAREWMTAP